jgi:murein DD-endopeptidase MepM/ murein hydrolase activator NlpD
MGTPVLASSDGTVIYTGEHFFAGKSVFIDHGMGIISMYFHLSQIKSTPGQKVSQGQIIGRVGKTGRATGPHLHWGVRIGGSRVDPLSLISLFKTKD